MEYEIKYKFLTNYLKNKIENNDYLDIHELKKILEALEVEINKMEEIINE
jgi:hypothetical protein